jgi:methylenetetrahydrofolate reductase (NADPH)
MPTDLIRQIAGLNHGKYLHDEEQEAAPTDLCIGAACYPEKARRSVEPQPPTSPT